MAPYRFVSVGKLPIYKTKQCGWGEYLGCIESGDILFFLSDKVSYVDNFDFIGAPANQHIFCHAMHSTQELIGWFKIGDAVPLMNWFEEVTDDDDNNAS